MPNTLKLLIPIVLGLVAAFINYIVLSNADATIGFVTVKDEIKFGESFDGKTEVVNLPKSVANNLEQVAILGEDEAILLGHRATRDLSPGDVILYRDTDIREGLPRDIRSNQEAVETILLGDNRIVGAEIGDYVWFRIPGYSFIVEKETGEQLVRLSGESEELGPFRIVGIGYRTVVAEEQKNAGFNSNSVTIAFKKGITKDYDKLRDFLDDVNRNEFGNLRIIGVTFKPGQDVEAQGLVQ